MYNPTPRCALSWVLVGVLAAFPFGLVAGHLPRGRGRPAYPDSLHRFLEHAIVVAGGSNLGGYPALNWKGRAVVHAGGRDIHLEGTWQLRPPDSARVETIEVDKGQASRRIMTIAGNQGWMEFGGQRHSMPPDVLAQERDQFYLYYLMRLIPLRDEAFLLSWAPRDSAGLLGIRVTHSGRPDVELYFDRHGRIRRLENQVTNPSSSVPTRQTIAFEGVIEAGGIRWPRQLRIRWNGQPYFDLDLDSLTPGERFSGSIPR